MRFKISCLLILSFACLCFCLGSCNHEDAETSQKALSQITTSSRAGADASAAAATSSAPQASEVFPAASDSTEQKSFPYKLNLLETDFDSSLGENPADLITIKTISDEEYSTRPDFGEIRPVLFFNDGFITKRSRYLSVSHFDAPQENPGGSDFRMENPEITLAVYSDHLASVLSCTPLEAPAAYAYVAKHIVDADFVPFSTSFEREIRPLLILLLKKDGEPHTFLIDEDYHILHFPGVCDFEQEHPSYTMVTDISAEKIDSSALLGCLSAAAYTFSMESSGNRDFFKLNYRRFTEGAYGPSLNLKTVLGNAFEKTRLRVDYRGSSAFIDSPEVYENLIRYFCGGSFDEFYDCDCRWKTEKKDSFTGDGMRFVLLLKDPEEGEKEIWADVYLTPQGELQARKDGFVYMQSAESGVYQISFKGRFICSPLEKYSLEEVLAILGW